MNKAQTGEIEEGDGVYLYCKVVEKSFIEAPFVTKDKLEEMREEGETPPDDTWNYVIQLPTWDTLEIGGHDELCYLLAGMDEVTKNHRKMVTSSLESYRKKVLALEEVLTALDKTGV